MSIAWAEREIELLKKQNKPDTEDEFDYIGECCNSALKAYKSLLDDGHSGMSIGVTKEILDRLINDKPLTPIEDTDDTWNKLDFESEYDEYICKRMHGLFKNVYSDGRVEYSDVNRVVGININNPNAVFSSSSTRHIVNELYPITFPYMPPNKPYKVYTEDFLYDENNGDFDTEGFLYLLTPEGTKVELNKFYHYPARGSKIELTKEEYERMKANKVK